MMRSGGHPSAPRYSISAPSCRSASTRSLIGRSCMLVSPKTVKTPRPRQSAAQSGRMAVPALPRNRSLPSEGKGPPALLTTQLVRSSDISRAMPSAWSAAIMCLVSSLSSRLWTLVVPSVSAESNRTRLERLLEPGSVTTPSTRRIGCRTSWSTGCSSRNGRTRRGRAMGGHSRTMPYAKATCLIIDRPYLPPGRTGRGYI